MRNIAVGLNDHSPVADLWISPQVSNTEDWCGRNFSLNQKLLPLGGLFPAKRSLKNWN
jgi:hypothetical protein